MSSEIQWCDPLDERSPYFDWECTYEDGGVSCDEPAAVVLDDGVNGEARCAKHAPVAAAPAGRGAVDTQQLREVREALAAWDNAATSDSSDVTDAIVFGDLLAVAVRAFLAGLEAPKGQNQ